ncbi:MAG: hypothetical protein V4719_14650 [Planctomycetota bacterium]
MTIQIPNTCNAFMETVGCWWHFQGDIKDLEGAAGTKVSIVDAGDCKAFCRSVVERRTIEGQIGVYAHVEVAFERFFSGKTPEPSNTLDQISNQLETVLKDNRFNKSAIMSGFRIPMQQIAAGSALSALFGSQARLQIEHQAILTSGTLSLTGAGSPNEVMDTLTFELSVDDGKAYALISTEGVGEDLFSLDCLKKAAGRMSAIFNKLVLAKEEPQRGGASNGYE